jgi:hypothetical protein
LILKLSCCANIKNEFVKPHTVSELASSGPKLAATGDTNYTNESQSGMMHASYQHNMVKCTIQNFLIVMDNGVHWLA